MASTNPNSPFGFRLTRNANGDYPRIDTRVASASVNLPPGSIARVKTDGTVAMWDGTATNGSRLLLGAVIAGVTSANTDREVKICMDPEAEYEVMLDDGSVTGINGLLERNFTAAQGTTISQIRSLNATLLQSTAALDASTGSSLNGATGTNIRPFRALRFTREISNDSSQSFARVIVKINAVNHALTAANSV